jgi:hypothetical protein
MHEKTLYLKTRQVLENIQSEEILEKFYLAGGTALALHLGHRKSVALHFFSSRYPPHEQLLQYLNQYNPKITQQDIGTLDVFINDVKVSFFEYNYPLLEDTTSYQNIELASVIDIACMKLVAVSQRGTKKDFVDLYKILQEHEFPKIYAEFEKKYKNTEFQKLHILKSLVFFEDSEEDPEPDYLEQIEWENVKKFFVDLVT